MIKKALEVLQRYFGFTQFRDGQQKVIGSLLQGLDTLAIMPTGAGKSLAYQIPALLFKGTTLVISPLISLMKDQVDALLQYGVPATFINSSLSLNEVRSRIDGVTRGKYKLLYIAPERLESESFRGLLESLQVSFLVIDEAHCVSQWGHDFRPSYLHLGPFLKSLPQKPIIGAFTATATEEVQADIVRLLELDKPSIFVTGFDRPNLMFSTFRGENKKEFVLGYTKAHVNQPGIIYAATRKEVDNLQSFLTRSGLKVGKYHAGMSDPDRQKTQEDFLFDEITVMVATNAFGMGIDKSNVRYVIHYNMPKNMEAYYQEAGRAGRDGEPGECLLLFSPQDVVLQRFLIEQTVLQPERKMNELKKLQGMVDYCHSPRCLRKTILEYFGEENVQAKCNNCSNCNDEREIVDITLEAQKIFSCIYRMRERFGIGMVADVLKGSRKAKIRELRFDELSTYGIMHNVPLQDIKDLINYLVAEGYLQLANGEYPVVKLQPNAASVLKGEAKVSRKITQKPSRVESEEVSLFEKLRELRRELAIRENLPPYLIFADSTLREMAQICPMDHGAMISVSGVGERKLEKYGNEFLEVIKRFLENAAIDKKENSSEKCVSAKCLAQQDKTGPEVIANSKASSHLQTFQMYKEGHSLAAIAKIRKVTPITVQNHFVRCSMDGHAVPWDDFIPKEQEVHILEAIRQVGGEKLRPIKDLLPDEVEWFTIRAVLEKYKIIDSKE
ncbi:DNA helicase RecQ [Desulfosporosinus meridiei]|uniref:DNA helicase RecQ n=1 Tax=Desulfosporosinus meridiei (strain ATCC BAA-275 / DSM 13257 / KCTC 12902 / NCIMB 13706 / S10) TaxID=768704 RepID=J7IRW3_DESMD|nr:DNA helicase RecQ [Desulfosporosinus meridiei]AFQ42929.1 ATP-dependent DNA helicase, RecQ-like protein [Desulfosporosinus meridiei DSM 13257]